MPEYLVELYLPRTDTAVIERSAERARLGAELLTRAGTPVRFVRSIFVPDSGHWIHHDQLGRTVSEARSFFASV